MGNLSMLNLSDNWAANVSGMGTQGLLAGGATGGVGMGQSMGSQYPGMWMPSAVGNLGNVSQSCAMPYLRSAPSAYSLPASGPSSSSSPSTLGGTLQTSSGVPGQPGCDHPYDLGAYSAATARDPSRSNWSPLTPPPLWWWWMRLSVERWRGSLWPQWREVVWTKLLPHQIVDENCLQPNWDQFPVTHGFRNSQRLRLIEWRGLGLKVFSHW